MRLWSGADPIETRPGFASLLDRIEGNGVRTVIVETHRGSLASWRHGAMSTPMAGSSQRQRWPQCWGPKRGVVR
jgi:hypothetical protein